MTTTSAPGTVAPLPLVILLSGRGSNMQAIADQAARGTLPVAIHAVISDKPDAPGLAVASALGIPTESLSPRAFADRPTYDAALADIVASYQPGLVVLAGFMRILTPRFIARFAGRILNVHPSLLPKYPGLNTHRRVLENRDTAHGVSIHFVTEELDGGPVIIQSAIAVQPHETESTLSARVQRQEHKIYPQAIAWFASGRLELRDHEAWLDGLVLRTPVSVDADESLS